MFVNSPLNYQNANDNQTFQVGDMRRGALSHKYALYLKGVVLLCHVTNEILTPPAEDVSTPKQARG